MPSSPRAGGADGTVALLRLVDTDMYPDLEAVYRDNVDGLYRLMYARVGNRADAEDLTAEVFRSAIGRLRLGASRGEVRAYLLTTARTALASHWRRRLGRPLTFIDPTVDIELLADTGFQEDHFESRERANQILAALPERFRRILELRFLESSTLKEAAAEMNVTVGNAKVLQHRALRMATRIAEDLEDHR